MSGSELLPRNLVSLADIAVEVSGTWRAPCSSQPLAKFITGEKDFLHLSIAARILRMESNHFNRSGGGFGLATESSAN
jgi:hypothetical protein